MSGKVLIVDDSEFFRRVLSEMLSGGGYEVSGAAANLDEAVDCYRSLKPDVVTMDIVMPGSTGMEAVKRILEIDPKAKIIMLSSLGHEDIIEEALSVGARAYLNKPFEAEKLMSTLQKVLHAEEET